MKINRRDILELFGCIAAVMFGRPFAKAAEASKAKHGFMVRTSVSRDGRWELWCAVSLSRLKMGDVIRESDTGKHPKDYRRMVVSRVSHQERFVKTLSLGGKLEREYIPFSRF